MTTYYKSAPLTVSASGLPVVQTSTTAAPSADFSITTAGMRATFVASSTTSSSVLRYQWSFSDSTTAQGSIFKKTFSRVGTYSATLTVTDTNYRKVSVTKTVKVTNSANVADLFDRSDNTSTLGTAADGTTSKTWAVLPSGNTFGVVNKAAKVTSGSVTCVAYVDVGSPSGTVQADVSTMMQDHARGTQLVFRFVDASNYFLAQSYFSINGYAFRIMKKVANTNTELFTVDVSLAPGDTVRIVDSGTTLGAYLNGILLTPTATSIADTSLNTATKVGIGGGFAGDPVSGWDNFLWTANVS
jgi:hypothetical protein